MDCEALFARRLPPRNSSDKLHHPRSLVVPRACIRPWPQRALSGQRTDFLHVSSAAADGKVTTAHPAHPSVGWLLCLRSLASVRQNPFAAQTSSTSHFINPQPCVASQSPPEIILSASSSQSRVAENREKTKRPALELAPARIKSGTAAVRML